MILRCPEPPFWQEGPFGPSVPVVESIGLRYKPLPVARQTTGAAYRLLTEAGGKNARGGLESRNIRGAVNPR